MAISNDWHKIQNDLNEPLHYCPPQRPDEIICEGSDAEDDLLKTLEKRQRYADAAARYLQGRVPLLQSARLRGPFGRETGWVNPWRYQHREGPDWWYPVSGEILFTRTNVMQWAKTNGLGHLGPAEALARCKAQAAAATQADATNGLISRTWVDSTMAQRDFSNGEKYFEWSGNEIEEDSGSDVAEVTVDEWSYSNRDDISRLQSRPSTSRTQHNHPFSTIDQNYAPNSGSLPGNATRGAKRALDSQWLRSNISKRTKLASPPVSTPTPIFDIQTGQNKRSRQVRARYDNTSRPASSDQESEVDEFYHKTVAQRSSMQGMSTSTMEDSIPGSGGVQGVEPASLPVSINNSGGQSMVKKRKRVPGLEHAQAMWESLQPKSSRGRNGPYAEWTPDSTQLYKNHGASKRLSMFSMLHDSDSHATVENGAESKVFRQKSPGPQHRGQSKALAPRRRSSRSLRTDSRSGEDVRQSNRILLSEDPEVTDQIRDDSQESSFASIIKTSVGKEKTSRILPNPRLSHSDFEPEDLSPIPLQSQDPIYQTPTINDSHNSFVTEVAPSTRGLETFQFRKKRKSKIRENKHGHNSLDKAYSSIEQASSRNDSPDNPNHDFVENLHQEAPQLSLDFVNNDKLETEAVNLSGQVKGLLHNLTPRSSLNQTPKEMQSPQSTTSPCRSSPGDWTINIHTPRVPTPKIPTPKVPTPFEFEMSFGENMFLGGTLESTSVSPCRRASIPKVASPKVFSGQAVSPKPPSSKVPTPKLPANITPLISTNVAEASPTGRAEMATNAQIQTQRTTSAEGSSRSKRSKSWDMVDDARQKSVATAQTGLKDQIRTPRTISQDGGKQTEPQLSRSVVPQISLIKIPQIPPFLESSQQEPIIVYVSGKLDTPATNFYKPKSPEAQPSPLMLQKSPQALQQSPEKSQTLPKLHPRTSHLQEADPFDVSTQSYDSAFATSPLKRVQSPRVLIRSQLDIHAGDIEGSDNLKHKSFGNSQSSTSDIEEALDQSSVECSAQDNETTFGDDEDNDDLDVVHKINSRNEQESTSQPGGDIHASQKVIPQKDETLVPEMVHEAADNVDTVQKIASQGIPEAEQSPFQASYVPIAKTCEEELAKIVGKGLDLPQIAQATTPVVQDPQSPWAIGNFDHNPVAIPTKSLVESFVFDEPDENPLSAGGSFTESEGARIQLDWQLVDRPATPDDNDEIRPFRDLATPSPERDVDREEHDRPAIQLLYNEADNPWKSNLRNPTSERSTKRVSFGVLPVDERESFHIGSSLPKTRPVSPPPSTTIELDDEELSEEDDDTTKANTLANMPKVAIPRYRPVLTGTKYNMNESPVKRSSPPLDAMAEAFIAADWEVSSERERGQTSFDTPTRHLKPMKEARTNIASQEIVEDPNSMDSFSITPAGKVKKVSRLHEDFSLDDIMDDIEGWSVEAELKQANSEANSGKHGAKKTPKRRERLSGFSSVWS